VERYWGGRAQPVPAATFAEAVTAVRDGDAEFAVLPVWNSTIGRIVSAWEALRSPDDARLRARPVGEITIPVRHCLLSRHGVPPEAITGVMGHPAALAQCSALLARRALRALPAEDSAGAARALAEASGNAPMRVPGSDATVNPLDTATLAPAAAAARYGLVIIAADVQDQIDNRTSFLVLDRGHRTSMPQLLR
jgi:prephenate dehydratase